MDILLKSLTICFFIVCCGVIIYAYFPVIRNIKIKKHSVTKKQESQESQESQDRQIEIDNNLSILNNETNANKLSNAIVELIRSSYILIHVLVNKGKNYDDEVQYARFMDYLTKDAVEKMKSLEGKNGKCSF